MSTTITFEFICENISTCEYSSPVTKSINEKLKTIDLADLRRRDDAGNKIAYYIAQGGNFDALNIILRRSDIDPFGDVFYDIGKNGEDFISFYHDTNAVVNPGHMFYASYFAFWLNFFKTHGCFSEEEINRILAKEDTNVSESYGFSY